jgi:hypothetical protein
MMQPVAQNMSVWRAFIGGDSALELVGVPAPLQFLRLLAISAYLTGRYRYL